MDVTVLEMKAVSVSSRIWQCPVNHGVRARSYGKSTLGSRNKTRRVDRVTFMAIKDEILKDVSPKDAPLRSLFPEEPPPPGPNSPKLRVAIVGGGLAGLSTAVELLDQGFATSIQIFVIVLLFEGMMWRSMKEGLGWVGKWHLTSIRMETTSRWISPFESDNFLQWGLHVFFGCYFNLFRLMAKCGVLQNLELKEHVHTFINKGGDVRSLDFRFEVNGQKIGAPFHGKVFLKNAS